MLRNASILARRAVHQYRRRDIFSYLGLRLYLANSAAPADRWARDVAVKLVQRRSAVGYIKVEAFKEKLNHNFVYRIMYLPAPNEILAETALIDACAKAGGKFDPLPCVFSYQLPDVDDASGVYKPYFAGFAKRHVGIASACQKSPNGWVVNLDLRKFYPSISLERAKMVWIDACDASSLDIVYRELGLKLLNDYEKATDTPTPNKTLITGPMFSHLVGNLVLRDLDVLMSKRSDVEYFRYVDDLALVGQPENVKAAENEILAWCRSRELQLNQDKRLVVSVNDWIKGANDFGQDPNNEMWAALVGRTKRLLIRKYC